MKLLIEPLPLLVACAFLAPYRRPLQRRRTAALGPPLMGRFQPQSE